MSFNITTWSRGFTREPALSMVKSLMKICFFSAPESNDISAQFLPIDVSIPVKKDDSLNRDVNAPLQPCSEFGTQELPWKYPRLDVLSEVTVQGMYKYSYKIFFKVTLLTALISTKSQFSLILPFGRLINCSETNLSIEIL